MVQKYTPLAASARDHAEKRLAELEEEAKRHREILELERKLEETLAAYMKEENIDKPANAPKIPQTRSTQQQFPLGTKERFYDRIVREVLEKNGTANAPMFMARIAEEKVEAKIESIYAYLSRSVKPGKVKRNPEKSGYYLLGDNPAASIQWSFTPRE